VNELESFILSQEVLHYSLMDSIASSQVKIAKGEGVGVHSLVRNTLGVEGRVKAPK